MAGFEEVSQVDLEMVYNILCQNFNPPKHILEYQRSSMDSDRIARLTHMEIGKHELIVRIASAIGREPHYASRA